MHTTSATLLNRLKQPGQPEAWSRFVRLYSPMLYAWAKRMGLQNADAADLVQEVFATLVQKLPEFDYDDHKRFRSWLWTVTKNKWQERKRKKKLPTIRAGTNVLTAPEDESVEEAEFRRHILAQVLPQVEQHFEPKSWRAFWLQVVEDKSPRDVAKELGISVTAVYIAKSRVLARLQKELADMLIT